MHYIDKFLSKITGHFVKTPLCIPPFAGDVLKLVGGTAFAQALAVLASPVLTRLYGPEAFGIAALFVAVTGIISVVACLRYELAIMLPKRDGEAACLLGLSLLLAATMSLLLVSVFWLVQNPILQLLNAQELAPYIWLVLPAVFLSGAFMALNYRSADSSWTGGIPHRR